MPPVVIEGGATTPRLKAHLSTPPTGAGPWPAVVVLHEIFGLNDDIRQHADRLAAAGYLAVAPDLYSAGGAPRCLLRTFRTLTRGEGPALADLDATRAWAAGRSDCTGKVGVIGFCLGGAFALPVSTRGFDVSAPNYGVVPKDPEEALRGACPIVASYGGRDRGLPGAAPRLEAALQAGGVAHDVKEYPDAGHSFLNRHSFGPAGALLRVGGVGYEAGAAEDAWGRILRFFANHLDGDRAAAA